MEGQEPLGMGDVGWQWGQNKGMKDRWMDKETGEWTGRFMRGQKGDHGT